VRRLAALARCDRVFLAILAVSLLIRLSLALNVDQLRPRSVWVALAILIVLLVAWIRDLPLLSGMLTNGGAEHRFLRRE